MKQFYLILISLLFATQSFAQVTVTVDVPTNTTPNLAASYPSLAAAVTAVSGVTGMTGPVMLTCAAGTETAPATGYVINNPGGTSSTNTITFNTSGTVTLTASASLTVGALNDAIFKLIGADFITINGFSILENPANTVTTAASNTMVEWGVALLYATTTNGAQNCTIQNNTITLNRTYQNTFGIYSNSTHSATSISTSATATTAAGGNSGLRIYGNSISNVNIGMVVVGPTPVADANTGIDIGGAGGAQANSITNFGTTGTFSSYVNVSGTVNGILVRNSNGFNISFNTITSSAGGTTVGTLNGIQIPAASLAPTSTFTNNINNNVFSLQSAVAAGAINGITYPSGSASTTSVVNINNNNFTTLGHTVTASGTITAISAVSTHLTNSISNNTFTNLTPNTTGSFTFISNSTTLLIGGSRTVSNNSIVTAFNKTGAGGTVTLFTSGSFSVNGSTNTFTGNNFSNVTVTGTTTIAGFVSSEGNSATDACAKTFTGNTFNNITGGTGSITVVSFSFGGATNNISNNTITNITGQGAVTALNLGSSNNGLNVSQNTITNITSTGVGGAVTGIASSSSGANIGNISQNTISTLSSTGASAVTGISISGATTTNVYKNTLCNISGSNASSTVNGILVSLGTTVNISNNRIGDLRTPVANAANPLIGINITGGTTISCYYNTVNIVGTSSGALFGSSAISVSVTPTITLNNNIFYNGSSVAGAGLAVAHRRSSATLTTYGAASNRNDFSASTIYTDGITPLATIGAYQALVTPRDANSISVTPVFTSESCGNASFLKVNTTTPTQIESGGANIAGYTDDFEDNIRQGNGGYGGSGFGPDIGADEFEGMPLGACSGTPAAATITGAAAVCTGSSTTLSLSMVYSELGITHHWASSTVMGGPYSPLGTASSQNTGNLTVPTYFIDTIRCTLSGMFYVTPEKAVSINGLPSVMVNPTAGTICIPGGAPIPLNASGASTYAWSPATGLSGTTGASVTANPTTTTVYTVTGTDGNGCSNTATSTITISGAITLNSVTAVPSSVCTGGNTVLTANASFPPYTYCTSTHSSGCSGDDITNVVLGTIMNPTTGCGGASHFTYFNPSTPTTTTTLTPGGSPYTLTLSFGIDGNQYFGAWIDYNQDGVFSASEFLGASGNAGSSGSTGISFTIPGTANNGISRLRIIGGNDSAVTSGQPCGASSSTWGETQDYNVTIAGATNPFTYLWNESPASGTLVSMITNPTSATNITLNQTYSVTVSSGAGCTVNGSVNVTVAAGAVIGTQPQSTAKCVGKNATFTVLASGPSLTYQWEESTNGGMSWNTVTNGGIYSGATTLTLTLTGVSIGMNSYKYRCVVTSVCGSPATSDGVATLTVNPNPTASLTPTGQNVICQPLIHTITAISDIGNSYIWKKNSIVIAGATTSTYSATTSGRYKVIISVAATGCNDSTAVLDTLTVNPQPTGVTATASATSICSGSSIDLFSTADSGPAAILSQGFEGGASGWTFIDSLSTGASLATQLFHIETAPYNNATGSALFTNFGITGAKFVMSDSDAGGSGSQTRTFLVSPTFSTVGYSGLATLTFNHGYQYWASSVPIEQVKVQITSNGGANWTDLVNYSGTSQGSTTSNAQTTVAANLVIPAPFMNQSSVQLRWRYLTNWGYYWVIDDILLTGVPTANTFGWTSNPSGFASAIQNPTGVTPAVTTAYTVTVTNAVGCTTSATVNVTVESTVVKSQANSGGGSLRSVYACIADGGTITYDYPLADTSFMTAPLIINKNVTILGNGTVLIDFQGSMAQGLDINAAKTLTLENMNVNGGAGVTNTVLNNGTLKLSASTVNGTNDPVIQNNAGSNIEVITNSGTSNIKQN